MVFRFNPAFADILFAGSGHTYKELLALAAQGRPVPSFRLEGSLSIEMQFDTTPLISDNVIGVLRGSDPALAGEHVVLSAHLDGCARQGRSCAARCSSRWSPEKNRGCSGRGTTRSI